MLPPIESSVLVANPKFEVLYSDLCANKLNENGSSKLDVKAQKERDVLRQVSVQLVSSAADTYYENTHLGAGAISNSSRGCETRSHPSQPGGLGVPRRFTAGRCTQLNPHISIGKPHCELLTGGDS